MIRGIKEINFPKYATLSQASITLTDMGERTISTQIKIDGDVVPDFSFDWKIEYDGDIYIHSAREPQASKDNTSLRTTVDLTFRHWAVIELQRYYFMEMASTEAGTAIADRYEASLGLTLPDFVTAFNKVLDYYFHGNIRIDLNPSWVPSAEPSFFNINYSYLWEVLQRIHEIYGVRWTMQSAGESACVIKLGYDSSEATHIFEYGYNGGLLKVERQVQSTDIRNILLGRGGDKNLPYMYFKDFDKYGNAANSSNGNYSPDPDAVPELKNIAFTQLRSAEFRSYVQGWAARHYGGSVSRSQAYVGWAWEKGYTDSVFSPVEYVKDDESIAKYGEQWGALDDNDEIYPSMQNSGLNDVVAVEEVTNDYVSDEVAEGNSVTTDINGGVLTFRTLSGYGSAKASKKGLATFIVPEGYVGNVLPVGEAEAVAYLQPSAPGSRINPKELSGMVTVSSEYTVRDSAGNIVTVGLQPGEYTIDWEATIQSSYSGPLYNITVTLAGFSLINSTKTESKGATFDIWIKNIWETSKESGETDLQYAQRVWLPILGSAGEKAQITFTTGLLSVSSDYQFTIVGIPVYDDSKSYPGGQSHWRVTLGRSQAEYEATGKLIPNTQINAVAGDEFLFTGIEVPHKYVEWAEQRLHDWKKDNLINTAAIQPTWIVSIDKIRANQKEAGDTAKLIDQLKVGSLIRIADKRLIEGAPLELYVQSVTYTWQEPSDGNLYLYPDVEVVLSDKVMTVINPVAQLQGEISLLQKLIGSASNIQQLIRFVGDRLYLRKDGIADTSLSPTKFANLVTGSLFRQGTIGGRDWGFYRDNNGHAVLEVDRAIVRDELIVNTLTINQVSYVGGMQINSAAAIECSSVEELENGYKCFFDQKQGTVANLFRVDDVAMCQQWDADTTTHKFYKRRVVETGEDYIVLTKGYEPAEDSTDTGVYGSGVPAEGDNIVQYGNYTNKERQYVIIRDVIGGGYERMLERLDSVDATGEEYYFAGRQSSTGARWFVGDRDTNQYAEYVNGELNISGRLNIHSQFQKQDGSYSSLSDYLNQFVTSSEDINNFVEKIVGDKADELQKQIDGAIETWFYPGVPTLDNAPASDWKTDEQRNVHLGDLYYDQETGKCYRFQLNSDNEYEWREITDTDIQAAMEAANKAQDTADNKRRVFFKEPEPPYDAGDLWVNATYGTQYKDDILRCITGRQTGSFLISDWTLASNYTDDTLAKAAQDAADKALKEANEANGRLAEWAKDGVISPTEKQAIKDEIARIDADKSLIESGYTLYDLGTPTDYLNSYEVYRAQLVELCAEMPETIPIPADFAANQSEYYAQRTLALYNIDDAIKKDVDYVKKEIKGYEYIKKALNESTAISGGLVLTSLIQLGVTELDTFNVYSGINGVVDTKAKGNGIAAWYGGDMVDGEADGFGERVAQSLFRFDGSGYLAGGNITWNADGSGSVGKGAVSWDENGITLGDNIRIGSSDETLATVLNFMADFNRMFELDKTSEPGKTFIKAKYDGFYSMGFVSAKGAGTTGGSGGGGGVSYDRLDSWEQYDKDKSDWVLSAGLGYDLYERIAQIESGGGGGAGVSSFRITGSGNAITSVSAGADGRELIFERGASFVTLDTAQTITGEKTFQNLIKIGKATVSWDEKNQALKFDTPLYSEGFVSAGGLSDTGGSAAAIVNLWQLEDVSISNPKNGQVLAYADGKWVNTTIETGGAGLDESELAAYLTSKGYATQAWVTGLGYITSSALTGYVKKSGDTMTGALTVPNVALGDCSITTSANGGLNLKDNDGHGILFQDTFFGPSSTGGNGVLDLGRTNYRWSNIYSVLGNFSGQITSSVATGTAPLSVASTTLVSNLNADMIDGYHETSFMRYRGEVPLSYVDITDYTAGAEDFIKSLAPGIYNAPRPGAGEIVVNLAKNTGSTSALQFHTTYQASGALRFRKTVDNNRVSGAWTTILTNLNIGSYTAGSANTLATSRKLWGQSFNGSADVSGDLTGVGSITMTGSLKIGGATLTWDSTNNALKIDTGMYSTAFMSAGGLSNTGNTGGGDFDPSLLAGMLYLGEATTATTPYSGVYKCYYTATAAGTYSKFASGITVNAGEMVFIGKDGSGWRVLHRVNLGSATGGSVEWSAIANKPSWLTGTVGSNVKPIYMNAGELTASSYSFGNASGNIPVSNGTVNTNLNADLLDGVHASGLFSSLEMSGNNVSITVGGTTKTLNVTAVGNLSTLTMSKNDNSGYPTYLLIADVTTWYNTTSSPYAKDCGIVGIIVGWRTGNMSGTQVNRIIAWTSYSRTYYRLQTDATGFYLPKIVSYDGKYYLALKLTGSGRSFYFIGYKTGLLSSFIQLSCNSAGEYAGLTEVFTESGIAMNGNASSATKLSTARTIWGQSFDGSANVTGAMTGVTTVNGVLTMPTSSSRIAELQAAANQTVGYRTVGSQYSMYFGIGNGNVNRGIYDTTNGGWMIYRGSSTNIYVPSGTFTIGTTTDYSGYSLVVSGNARITSGGLIVPYSQGTYLSMATRTTDITGNTAATASNAHSLYKVKTVSANVVAFGGLGDNVGFYGFYASRISAGTNGTDWSTVWNTNTGALTHNKAMTVSGAVTFSSTLSVSGAVTFSSTLSVTDSVSTPNINGGGGNLLIGNSGNKAFIQFQEDVKQINNNWHIDNDGTASFGSLTVDGDLEISGDMEIEGDLIPYRNNDYYIGSSSYRWANVYTQLLNVAGAATLGSTLSVGGNTTPSSNNSYTLGSSTYRWSNVYAVLGNFSGAVTMSSTLTVSGNTTVNGTLITKYLNGGGSDLTIGNSNNSGYVYFQEDLRQLNSKWQISNDGEAEFSTLSVSGTFTIGTPTSGSLKIGGATLSWDNTNTALKVDKAYYSTDAISAGGLSTTSDARLKTILSDVRLTVEQIAAAPAKVFSWKKDGKPGAGSIAQYWQPLIPQAVHGRPDGFLGMEYGNIALVSAILIARKVNDHEERIKALERENAELKKEVERLKSAA